MSVSTAERFLRTQPRTRLHGLSTTTPGVLRKSQIPVRTFAQWEDDRPGFVEMDLRPRRHRLRAVDYRATMQKRFHVWNEIAGVETAV